MTHPMLEKVARAISPGAWCIGYNPAHRAASLICARAAVQALLEPDEGMVEAGASAPFNMDQDVGHCAAERVYRAMLLPLVEGEE